MKNISIIACCIIISNFTLPLSAKCPSADLTRDCKVTFEDFALFVQQWLAEGIPDNPPDMIFVSIFDPGVPGHEYFHRQISKYETTNGQYCQYLNSALATGDVNVSNGFVYASTGTNPGADFIGNTYYNLAGTGITSGGAVNGGASKIHFSGGVFSVESGFENHPVTYVSWFGAMAFSDYYGYSLPTEWQWQAVADFEGTFTYGCGMTIGNIIANYSDSIHLDGTTPAGAFGAFGYGVCDMAGNVWEWTSTLSGSFYVLRGGSWSDDAPFCTVSYRLLYPNGLSPFMGFRVCRETPP